MSRSDDEQLKAEQPWLQQAVKDLQRPVAPDVSGQLRAARRAALASGKQDQRKPSSGWNFFTGWPAVVVAGIGAMVVGLVVLVDSRPQPVDSHTASVAKEPAGQLILEDLSIVAGQDDLQFYQDLELLRWLEKEGDLDAQS